MCQQIGITNEEAATLLEKSIEMDEQDDDPDIPLRSDGTEYSIEDLAADQKESLADVLSALRLYCEGHDINVQKVLRVTVSGVAGSGKSTWINTLVTAVRKMFNSGKTIEIFAPTGSAAFNAGGQTLHRGFKLPLVLNDFLISATKQKYLLSRYGTTLVIIIDERSMVDATVLGIIKYYMQKCAHGGGNSDHPWGGIPIIIFVGDDYQLPPIMPGAFYALHQENLQKFKNMSAAQFKARADGFEEFLEMGKTVIYLEGEKRVNEGQEKFKQILRAIRCEDEQQHLTEDDVQSLLELDLAHKTFTDTQRKLIELEATYIFANKEPRDRLNSLKLKIINTKSNPVARIKSKTCKLRGGKQVTNQSHFDIDRQPNMVLICKDARMTLNGYNPDPKNGLFHGSLGIVRDIVYDIEKSPNLGDFPAYVLVEFYQYCGKNIIENFPRCVPVVAITVRCNRQCCSRTYMPLALAYGKTAHTFQGQNVGPVPLGRPENPIKKIIVDPGTRSFEGNNVGLFYQLLSRATTIGNREDKLSSAIYFDGERFSRSRFEKLTMKNAKEMYKKAALRKDWVEYLRKNEVKKGKWRMKEMDDLFAWANTVKFDDNDLAKITQRRERIP